MGAVTRMGSDEKCIKTFVEKPEGEITGRLRCRCKDGFQTNGIRDYIRLIKYLFP
jgi:hypothetical protein